MNGALQKYRKLNFHSLCLPALFYEIKKKNVVQAKKITVKNMVIKFYIFHNEN